MGQTAFMLKIRLYCNKLHNNLKPNCYGETNKLGVKNMSTLRDEQSAPVLHLFITFLGHQSLIEFNKGLSGP